MIKAGEIGKTVRYFTNYDMSAKTALEIHITQPSGAVVVVPNARISLSATVINDPDLGIMAANTYMIFATQSGDFPISGDYYICGVYTDATPKVFYGDKALITVGVGC